MKNLIISFGIGLALSACSGSSPAVKTASSMGEQPDWIQNGGRYEKGLGALGTSADSGLGTQVQREDALLSARNDLAKAMDSKIQSAISQTRQRLIEQGIAGASELGTLQTQNTARQLVNTRIKNSPMIKQWKDSANGELTVWVIINQEDLDRMQSDVLGKVVRKQLKNADKKHDDTIKNTFNEEFEKQFE